MIVKRTVQFRRDSRNLFIHLLTQCNLRCRHCYINPLQHGRDAIPDALVKKILDTFACRDSWGEDGGQEEGGAASTNLIFLGGEPTLHPGLPGFVEYAKGLGYSSITVDSNGFLFNDFLNRVSPHTIDNLSFSLDGASPEINDPIRGRGVYEKVTANIGSALSKGFPVSVIFTANSLNIHDLPNMVPLLEGLGVKRFFIQVVGLRGRAGAADSGGLQLTRRQWLDVVPGVAQEAAEKGIWVTYPKVFLDEGEPFECAGVVADNYFIFPNGRIYTCPLCEDYPLHSYCLGEKGIERRPPITEKELFTLSIPEGCVINKLLHPGNIEYDPAGRPKFRIACCMLKEELLPRSLQ